MKETIKVISAVVFAITGLTFKNYSNEKMFTLFMAMAAGMIFSLAIDNFAEFAMLIRKEAKERRAFKKEKREEVFEEKVLRVIREHEAKELCEARIAPKKRRYFSAAEVRAMSLDEVAENYEAICESMKEWG